MEKIKNKIIVLILSIILVSIITLLFFLDSSLSWSFYKIFSLIIVLIWVFFIIPSFRYDSVVYKGDMQHAVKIGRNLVSGICANVLFAPYYAIRYYFI